uniref:Uncharacterized protein n=1 Tax=Cannabis sativa TaxID=3483 RepID=A0A803QY27_CANSA
MFSNSVVAQHSLQCLFIFVYMRQNYFFLMVFVVDYRIFINLDLFCIVVCFISHFYYLLGNKPCIRDIIYTHLHPYQQFLLHLNLMSLLQLVPILYTTHYVFLYFWLKKKVGSIW